MKHVTKFFFLFLLSLYIFTTSTAHAQTGTVRVNGGGVQFFFTAYNQYSSGVTLTNRNIVKINYTFATPPLNWQLRVKSDYPSIMSANGSTPDIANLTYLKVNVEGTPTITPAGNTTVIINGAFYVDHLTPQVLVSGTGNGNFEVNMSISYSFGFPPPSLINIPWGLYYTNLTFILEYF
ncbi:MAG TPA: hypothetical protein PLH91_02045 [Tenuifilaceae bacterium]|nr:hypothetical protein [Tenuifilaceae bacterium]HPI43987.1 hypothetical protein [Tenuifilaceae bacterium]HPN21111.1 hypothetical protein [Tenuifilaceae bacterium]